MGDVERRWLVPERFPSLASGELHVWLADLAAAGAGDDALATLADDERARAARFLRPADRDRYVAAHAMLRRVLAGYVRVEPTAVAFRARPGGKPELTSAGPRFNLSHAGRWALVALAGEREVGADIEAATRNVSWRELAREVLTEAEATWLAGVDEAAQRREFLRLWVAKEAVVKAEGAGLRIKASTIAIGPLAAGSATESDHSVPVESRHFWLRHLLAPSDAVAAVACERAPAAVRLFRWS